MFSSVYEEVLESVEGVVDVSLMLDALRLCVKPLLRAVKNLLRWVLRTSLARCARRCFDNNSKAPGRRLPLAKTI